MLVTMWSPKGGSGTSIVSAVGACMLARAGNARLVDCTGDQPAVLGLASEPVTGVRDWLRVGVDAPVDALERLTVDAGRGLTLLPAGSADIAGVAPEVGAVLGLALRDLDQPVVVDAGVPLAPALEALIEVADAAVIVMRPCYLALRRAVRMPLTARAAGVLLVDEPGRALGAREIADVLGVPVLGTIPTRAAVSRVVDAGVLTARLPDAVSGPVRTAFTRLGVGREGRAA